MFLTSKRKMRRRSPSSSSLQKKRSKWKITLHRKAMSSKKEFIVDIKRLTRGNLWLESRTTLQGSSQSSQDQWSKDTPKGSKWNEMTKVSYETGLTIKERKAAWHTSGKESLKREEDIWTQAEKFERKAAKMTETEKYLFVDGLRRLK